MKAVIISHAKCAAIIVPFHQGCSLKVIDDQRPFNILDCSFVAVGVHQGPILSEAFLFFAVELGLASLVFEVVGDSEAYS